MKKFTFFLILSITVSFAGWGQNANNYAFTTGTGASLLTPTFSSTIVSLNCDDCASLVINFGFNFIYEGTTYTQFSVNSNGLMKLGSTAVTAQYSNNITDGTNVPKIMPLWDDLNSSSNGGIFWGISGTTPNRILVVDFRLYNSSGGGSYNCRFQVWLYETTNEIKFVYGTGTTPGSFSCGIGGVTASNYQSVTTSSHTSSNSSPNNSNNTWPGSGRFYSFKSLGTGVVNISSLPYTSTGRTTCGKVNDLTSSNTTVCGSSNYYGAEDEVFIFTPTVTGTHTISLTSTSSYVGIMLYQGNPLIGQGGTCVTNGYAQSNAGSQTITPSLTSGVTYYLIVDQWPSPYCIPSYNLSITPPSSQPDLTPYQPAEWNDKIPIGITQLAGTATHNYTGPYYSNQTLYLNWASINNGSVAATGYTVHVEVTGTGGTTFDWSGITTNPTIYTFVTNDQSVGPLSAGSHTFKVWCDYTGVVTESNETNNYYERTISITDPTSYCTPSYSSACSSDDYINNFSTSGGITNITNNGTGCNGQTNNYIFYSGMSVTQDVGLSFNISVQSGSTYAQGFAIWIDWNNNYSFTDINEAVWNSGTYGTGVFTGTITIPSGTSTGVKRIRVICSYNSVPTAPCGTYSYGETEDYTVTVTTCASPAAPATCSSSIGTPANGLEHHISLSCATVSEADGYDFDWSPDNSTWYDLVESSSSSYDDNRGNNPNTPYYYRARAYKCTPKQYSSWVNSSTFPVYTACDEPASPTVGSPTSSTLNVTLNTESPVANPAITTYSIYCVTTANYVTATGALGTEVYQTKAAWGTITVTGLTCNTSYTFYAKAQNYQGDVRFNASNTGSNTTSACFNPCTGITNITDCAVSTSTTIAAGTGVYNPPSTTCGYPTPGQEKIYTFTPSISGLHQIVQTASFGYIDYFFKASSGGCSGTEWTCIQDLNGAITSSTSTFLLTAGTQYYILLDPEGEGGGDVTFSINCPCTTPGTPTSLTGTATGQTSANLSWAVGSPTGSPTITYYWELYRSSDNLLAASGGTANLSESVSVLICGTSYYFKVRAFTSCNNTYSGWSSNSSAFTTQLPSAPTSVTATPSTICTGSSSNLNATSTGNSINWYTQASGGSPIGSSASGANFPVSPGTTTNYYAEAAGSLLQTFNYTGTIDNFTVPVGVTSITIIAKGAQGGSNTGTGGSGAIMTGTFSVSSGQVLSILVGQQPTGGSFAAGGGGTFVALGSSYSTATPLIVAGGGGGASSWYWR